MPTSTPLTNTENSDLKQFTQLVFRNYKVFIASIVLALIVAFLALHFSTPLYKISASLLIREESTKPSGGNAAMNDFLNSSLFGNNKNFQNELWVLKSTPVVEQTIQNLDLMVDYYRKKGFTYHDAYGVTPFRIFLPKDHIQPVDALIKLTVLDDHNFEIKAKDKDISFVDFSTGEEMFRNKKWKVEQYGEFGKLIETDEMAFVVELDTSRLYYLSENPVYYFRLRDVDALAGKLKERLEYKIIDKQATVIEITFNSPSVKKGKDIVNEIMEVYSQENLERKNHIAGITVDYIEKQLGEISDSLNITEESLQRFRSSNQLLNPTEQATGISAQYMDLQNQMAELITRKRYYDYVAENLGNTDDFSKMVVPSSIGISDQLLNNMMGELVSASAQRSSLIQNNQERNPMVQKLGIQIDNIKKTISENIGAVTKTTEITIDEMNKRIRRVEGQISRLPATQRQLGGIERKYRLNDAIYNYLLQKRAEAKITQASNMPDNIIIEPAKKVGDKPVSPKTKLVYLFALLLGFALPLGFFVLRNTLASKIDSQEMIEQITSSPVVGKIMHNHHKSTNIIFEHPHSTIAESFRALRTNIQYQFKDMEKKTILVTSGVENEGKSFSSMNLAMSYAQLGQKTLLMDFDLRKPTEYFGIPDEQQIGLTNWYSNGTSQEELIQHTPYDMLDIIHSGPIPANPAELLALKKTGRLINELKNTYDCIVLDTSPLAQVSDAYLLLDYADIKIVVARYNYSLRKVFALIIKDLKTKKVKNVCVLLNDNRVYSDQYGYGYGYYRKRQNHQKGFETVRK
jgi:capsular exopolysaccharide synthesis family protein